MKRCDQCKKAIRGTGHKTTTRTLCDICFAEFSGQLGGLMSSGGNIGTALYTGSLFKRRAEEEAKKKPKRGL